MRNFINCTNQLPKRIAAHSVKSKTISEAKENEALPAYLLDRQKVSRAKVLSNTIKQKRKEKAGKWDTPLPKVRPMAMDEMLKVIKTGKRKRFLFFCSNLSKFFNTANFLLWL